MSDSGFSYLALQNTYASGSRIDIGWFLGYLFVFLAARQAPRHAAAWMEPPFSRQSGNVVTYGAVGLAGLTMAGAVVRGGADPFVFWVGLFLVGAFVGRARLVAADASELEKSVEAWVPITGNALEDWVPLVGSGPRSR
jgi:hypothetical protein